MVRPGPSTQSVTSSLNIVICADATPECSPRGWRPNVVAQPRVLGSRHAHRSAATVPVVDDFRQTSHGTNISTFRACLWIQIVSAPKEAEECACRVVLLTSASNRAACTLHLSCSVKYARPTSGARVIKLRILEHHAK
jgi:hypothetical protein